MRLDTSSTQKPADSIKNEPLMISLKRQIKHQAIISVSVIFVIPALLFGIPQLVN